MGSAAHGPRCDSFLLTLLAGKIIATSLTIGIGGSGGVFAPSLFVGAMTGAAYGQTLHHFAPGLVGAAGAYGLIGMGAVFAGAARVPITAVVIMFELTGEYSIILPLMTAIVLATGVSHLLTGESSGAAALPVLDAQRATLLGWLSVQRVLRVLRPPTATRSARRAPLSGADVATATLSGPPGPEGIVLEQGAVLALAAVNGQRYRGDPAAITLTATKTSNSRPAHQPCSPERSPGHMPNSESHEDLTCGARGHHR